LWGEYIRDPRNNPQSYEEFYSCLSNEEKSQLRKLTKGFVEYFKPAVLERINNELDNDRRHQNLIKFCAKAFAKTDLALRSGYEFYFTEPLIEFCSSHEGSSCFDILLFNEFSRSAIIIECKTSIPSSTKSTMRGIEKSIKHVQSKLDYLSDIIGIQMDSEKIEYVLCVYDKDSSKVIESMKGQSKRGCESSYNPEQVKLWIYRPISKIMQLHLNHIHNNPELTQMLLAGFDEKSSKSRFELPYSYSSHHYTILQLAIIGDCYRKNLLDQFIDDPKIIKLDDISATLERNLSLGMLPERKKELINEKVECIIKYGERYKLIEKFSDNEIRLICVGNRIDLVSKNIRDKFFKNWVEEKSNEMGKEKALEEYKRKAGIKQLSDFPELFKIQE